MRPHFSLHIGDRRVALGRETKLMGILNVTPDSFSDGGQYLDPGRAAAQALKMQREGAHFIDVGAESSRPGARAVSGREQIRRLKPVFKRLAKDIRVPVSVDTTREDVARMALDEGAIVVNDIRALRSNRPLGKMIARYGAGVVLMHMQGDPRTMQKKPTYRNTVREVAASLAKSVSFARDCGIPRSNILIDPGFGFGKTPAQNLEMLAALDRFASLKLPVLVGLSRKSFIGHLLGTPVTDRLVGSVAAACAAIERGAHILRVHDVLAHRQAASLVDAALEGGAA